MEESNLQCPICNLPFDTKSHIPKTIKCGHSICNECAQLFGQKSQKKCCQKAGIDPQEKLETNYLIINQVKKREKENIIQKSRLQLEQVPEDFYPPEQTENQIEDIQAFSISPSKEYIKQPVEFEQLSNLQKNFYQLTQNLETEKTNYFQSLEIRIDQIENFLQNQKIENQQQSQEIISQLEDIQKWNEQIEKKYERQNSEINLKYEQTIREYEKKILELEFNLKNIQSESKSTKNIELKLNEMYIEKEILVNNQKELLQSQKQKEEILHKQEQKIELLQKQVREFQKQQNELENQYQILQINQVNIKEHDQIIQKLQNDKEVLQLYVNEKFQNIDNKTEGFAQQNQLVALLEKQNKEMQGRIVELENWYKLVQAQQASLTQHEKQILQLQVDKEFQFKNTQDLVESLSRKQECILQQQNQIQNLESFKQNVDDKMNQFEKILSTIQSQYDELNRYEKQILQLKNEKENIELQLTEKVKNLQSIAEERKQKIDDLRVKFKDLANDNKNAQMYKKQIDQLQEANQTMQMNFSKTNQELQQKVEQKKAKVENMKKQVEEVQTKLKKMNELDVSFQKIQNENKMLQTQLQNLQIEFNKKQEQKSQKIKELQSKLEETKSKSPEIDIGQYENQISQLQAQNEILNAQLKSKAQQIQKSEERKLKIQVLNQKVQELEYQLSMPNNFERQYFQLQSEKEHQEMILNEKINQLHETNQRLKKKLQEQKVRNKQMENEIYKAQQEIQKEDNDISQYSKIIQKLNQQIEQQNLEINEKTDYINYLEEKQKAHNSDILDLEEKIKYQVMDLQKLQNQQQNKHLKLEEKEEIIDQLKEQNKQLQDQLKQQSIQVSSKVIKELQGEIQIYQNEISELKLENQKLKQENLQMREQVFSLQSENLNFQTQVQFQSRKNIMIQDQNKTINFEQEKCSCKKIKEEIIDLQLFLNKIFHTLQDSTESTHNTDIMIDQKLSRRLFDLQNFENQSLFDITPRSGTQYSYTSREGVQNDITPKDNNFDFILMFYRIKRTVLQIMQRRGINIKEMLSQKDKSSMSYRNSQEELLYPQTNK